MVELLCECISLCPTSCTTKNIISSLNVRSHRCDCDTSAFFRSSAVSLNSPNTIAVQNSSPKSSILPINGAWTISRSARMTTAHMAALLHTPLRSVESSIMELTGTVNATMPYALDTVLAVALLIDTPETRKFVKSVRERLKTKE